MPIAALSDSVAKRLAGHINIASPVILVKELLDNAIDAQATTVEIIISSNTVDKIEIRDNGVGIFPDDYDSLGRRGHTSKLRTFEELSSRANTSLGFRGEALASTNSMAKVCVITKTSSDPVAASLQLHPKTGGVLTNHPASAPVGTTVIVNGLYSETPVREQVIIRDASKSLDGIKELLRSYAMARPHLRLHFKVLKVPRLNWSYAPKPTAGLQEAVLQIHGAAVLSQCLVKRCNASQKDLNRLSFGFEAVIVKPDAQVHLLPKGRYFSVDCRPLTANRGNQEISNGNAFICLNIICPPGSYDVNIEPSKDEVLFSDEETLLYQFGMFCAEAYGQLVVKPLEVAPADDAPEKSPSTKLDEINQPGLLPRNVQTADTQSSPNMMAPARAISGNPQFFMKKSTASVPGPAASGQDVIHGTPDRSPVRQLGEKYDPIRKGKEPGTPAPSIFITANALRRREQQQTLGERSGSFESERSIFDCGRTGDVSSDPSEWTEESKKRKTQPRHPLPTQKPTSTSSGLSREDECGTTPERPLDHWSIARMNNSVRRNGFSGYGEADQDDGLCLTPEPDIMHHYGAATRDLDSSPGRHSSSTGPFKQPYPSPMSSSLVPNHQAAPKSQAHHAVSRRRAHPPWTPPSSMQRDQQEWSSSFRSGLRGGPRNEESLLNPSHGQTKLDHFVSSPRGAGEIGARDSSQNQRVTSRIAEIFRGNSAGGNERMNFRVTEVFETPKGSRSQGQTHEFFDPRNASFPLTTQEKPTVEDSEAIITSIPTGDPRAYLLRRQKSAAAEAKKKKPRRLERAKSCFMPFENIPDNEITHNLLSQLSLKLDVLRCSASLIARFDGYVDDVGVEPALDMGMGEGRRVEERLDHLLSNWNEQVTGERTCIGSQLTTLLKGKGIETA
ncbi:fatty acid hydroxylase [Apiospora arundinis]|uniref:Post Meiotic Segregation 2 n=1 Tax=Apiospora arundinis TaxID=335852 RepID=A0ABR2JB36_9PEZI